MTTLSRHIGSYLNSMKGRWAPTTLRSETARLNSVGPYLDGCPETLWTNCASLAPYARHTAWVRVVHYVNWLVQEGLTNTNPYEKFRSQNAHMFRNAYTRSTPKMSYSEAVSKVQRIPCLQLRTAALSLLKSGLRVGELSKVKNGQVVGKGGKVRDIHNAQAQNVAYLALYRALKAVGLKPHDLRKLFASRLVEKGANEFELTSIMGWSSINTAQSYVRTNPAKLKKLVASATTDGSNE